MQNAQHSPDFLCGEEETQTAAFCKGRIASSFVLHSASHWFPKGHAGARAAPVFAASACTAPEGPGDVPEGRQEQGLLLAADVGLLWELCLRNTQGLQFDMLAKGKCSGSVVGHPPVNQGSHSTPGCGLDPQ